MKIRNNIFLITVSTVISLTQCFGDSGGHIASSAGPNGEDARKIKANIAKSEQNLARCKSYIREIDDINNKSKSILDNMNKNIYSARLVYIRKDIAQFEAELRNEKNPAKQAELKTMIKTIKEVDVELRRRGI